MESPVVPFRIRSFKPGDDQPCAVLYHQGLIGGQIAENDTGLDIDDIVFAYMNHPNSHFWVAETEGPNCEIVGMIGVQQHDDGVGEIRRLRVREDFRRKGIGSALVAVAIRLWRDRGFLNIALEPSMDVAAA